MRLLKIFRKIWRYKSFNFRRVETRLRNERRRRRQIALIASEGKCRKCGATENLTIDHIIPKSKGGSRNGRHNLQVLCERCNRYKADRLPPHNRTEDYKIRNEEMRTPHTGCWEGKRVRVKLKDGTTFVDKYDGAKGSYRFFKEKGKILAGDIKSFVIWKNVTPLPTNKT